MSWLRVDDGFTSNTKIAQLTDKQFRVWMRLLCHCGKSQDPTVDRYAIREVSGLNSALVLKLNQIGLLDKIGDQYEVHDWLRFQPSDPTNADRQAKWRARQALARNGNVTPKNVTPPVTEPLPRERARAVPVPSSPKRDLKAEQFSLPDDAALPSTQHLEDEDLPDRSDPVVRLLLVLNDRDDRTEAVLRSIAGRVSEAAFDYTRDEIQRTGGGAGKAVTILKRIAEEGTLASPRDETPEPAPVTMNGSSSGPAYIAGLIRNGVIADLEDLETELTLAGVEDEDRSSLLAQLQLAQQLEGRE